MKVGPCVNDSNYATHGEGVTVRVEDKALDFLGAVRSLLAKLVAGQHDLLEVVAASLAAAAA